MLDCCFCFVVFVAGVLGVGGFVVVVVVVDWDGGVIVGVVIVVDDVVFCWRCCWCYC